MSVVRGPLSVVNNKPYTSQSISPRGVRYDSPAATQVFRLKTDAFHAVRNIRIKPADFSLVNLPPSTFPL